MATLPAAARMVLALRIKIRSFPFVPLVEAPAVPCARPDELAPLQRGPEIRPEPGGAAGSRWPDQVRNGCPDRSALSEGNTPERTRKPAGMDSRPYPLGRRGPLAIG